ncbi:MAG TPA: efflux RND transporter periplasmic adaptor subunit [Labilithrix sp.]|nr:efflux RND transporter periplasmic adaptor subunit [Labilithrix sp.]
MRGVSVFLAGLACLAMISGCRHGAAQAETRTEPPIGEVWLTDLQIAEAKLKVEPLDEQDVDDVIVTSGKVAFDDAHVAHVFSPVSGRVTRIEAKVGQRVKKGDVLAVLESPDIGLASADLHKAEADRITAEHDLERQKELLAAHATSQRDFEQAEDAFRKAKAEVDRAKQKAGLFRTGSGGNVSQTYAVRSEIDGEVVARNVSPGGEVQGQYGGGAAVELFTVGELDHLWVVADVYEMDTPRVKVGSRVSLKLFSMPNKVFPAKIEWVAGTLDPATRTAKVRCILDNADRAFKPEMYATLFIAVDERKAIAIPRGALLRLGEQTAVFVEKGRSADGRHVFTKTPVVVDEAEGGRWLPLTKGPERGTRIVTEGTILLAGER